MDNSNYFTDLLKFIPDYRKIVLIKFLTKIEKDLLHEIGFGERDINRSYSEFKSVLIEQHEEKLDYIKKEEESIFEKILNKKM